MEDGAIEDDPQWPAELLLIRHGQSAGNVARDLALAQGLSTIAIEPRDCDVPLSDLGCRQSEALGDWLKDNSPAPNVVFASPYVRARQTASIALRAAQWDGVRIRIDERLREKEFGILDRLTRTGIEQRYPDQAQMRRRLGKFYYRPPGGESWTDVILRLRSLLDTLSREYRGERVAIVSHQVIVLCFRYLLENMTEEQILSVDAAADVANCSITAYRAHRTHPGLQLETYNFVTPIREAGETVTRSPDVPVAPK